MNSNDDSYRASALTRVLRAGLREARFSVTYLSPGQIEFVPAEHGSSTRTELEETSQEELDTHSLKALHEQGVWRQKLNRSQIRVNALCQSSDSASRLKDFEGLLDDHGILFERHIGHGLGYLLPGYHGGVIRADGYAPGHSTGVSATADLWSYLLVDACLTSPRRTANKVLRWVQGAPLAFETRVLLGRLNAVSSFALANGLAVERLPRKVDHVDTRFPIRSGVALADYLDRTILRIPCRIAPVLWKPTKVTEDRDGTPVLSWKNSANVETTWPMQPGGIRELARALSLVCDVAVETIMIWTDYSDHTHFGQQFGSYSSGTAESPPRTATETTLTADNLKKALRLQPKLCNMPNSLKTAFEYWLKSKARRPDLADRMVFLRTALEALFLDDGNRAELTFRLATNGAWYTGRNATQRRQHYNELRKIYAAASGAVHSGRVKNSPENLLTDGQEICRQAILKRLRSGQRPVWEDIVFGR